MMGQFHNRSYDHDLCRLRNRIRRLTRRVNVIAGRTAWFETDGILGPNSTDTSRRISHVAFLSHLLVADIRGDYCNNLKPLQ